MASGYRPLRRPRPSPGGPTYFFASLGPSGGRASSLGLKGLGFFHLGTGLWLMYLMFAVVLNFVFKYSWPV